MFRPHKKRFRHLFPFVIVLLSCSKIFSQSLEGDHSRKGIYSSVSLFAGSWSYRSFRSNPDLSLPVDELLFEMGELELAVSSDGQVTGTLVGEGWQLKLSGTETATNPATIRFQGKGTMAGEEWVYDYLGYRVPKWENGIDQRPVIVGTIVRTKVHSGGTATAAYVAQWIAVMKDPQAVVDQPKTSKSTEAAPSSPRSPAERETNLLKMYWDEYGNDTDATRVKAHLNLNGQPLFESSLRPETVRSVNGRLDVTLRVRYADLQIGNDPVRLRVYNDKLVGPVLRAKAGDTLYITLVNELPFEPLVPHGNGHHSWNTTNLHFHGLHVSPEGVAGAQQDNIFASLAPLPTNSPNYPATEKYEVQIPSNHVAGTFWYHAHRHGSVAGQVASGLAGALIIERDIEPGQIDKLNLDSIQEIRDAGEEVIVLQQIPYIWSESSGYGTVERVNADLMLGPGAWAGNSANPGLRRYVTVNGEKIPTIHMSPGEIRRLRFVHTGQREPVKLCVRPLSQRNHDDGLLTMYEIAVDGLPTGRRATRKHLELHPGYRSDVLLEVPQTASGVYYLMDDNAPSGIGERGSIEPLKWVMKIEVSGTPISGRLPSVESLAQVGLVGLPVDQVTAVPQLAFYGIHIPRQGSGESLRFLISRRDLSRSLDAVSPTIPEDRDYNSSNPPRLVQLNTIDRWLVGSRNGTATGGKPGITHPFHIHTNPFQIVRVSDTDGNDLTEQELGEGYTYLWRDTLAMKQGLTYQLLTKYEDFTGSFVNHCHILDHEDNGMMEKVTITDPTNPSPVTPLSSDAAEGPAQKRILTEIPEPVGTPQALFFVRGSFCPHCLKQVTEMVTKLPQSRCRISVISASTIDDLRQFPDLPYGLISDPKGELFKRFNLGDDTHGTILLNGAGEEVFRNTGSEPFMDASTVASVLYESTPTVAIDVRGTSEVTDDYITWAPTLCQARVVGGDPTGQNITVMLTNDDPASIPMGGDVRFATTVSTGHTATNETLELSLPQDGSSVSFYVAGAFGRPSTLTEASLLNGGRDAVIEVRRDQADGELLTQRAVMVRVRSDASKLNALGRAEFLEGLAELKASGRYEQLILLHTIAAGHEPGSNWPDQAHSGPGFLPWHRAFLLTLERELQKSRPYLSLHYWREDVLSTVFQQDFLGANTVASGAPVPVDFGSLAAGNPLHGWSVNGVSLSRWSYSRSDLSWCDDESIVLGRPNFRTPVGNNFSAGIESNPHNDGHGWVGQWMSNPRTSPRDPIFFLFHSDYDRLWAKWQWKHGRFGTNGADQADYSPTGSFGPGASLAMGHHLEDTMWPWDNKNGPQGGGFLGNRPPVFASDSSFPATNKRGIWPERSPGSPTVQIMIDYLGVDGSGTDLGFCYDDVPYGELPTSAPPTPLLVAGLVQLAVDGQKPWAERMQSLQALKRNSSTEQQGMIMSLAQNQNESDELRIAAFAVLQFSEGDWITPAISIVRKESIGGEQLRANLVRRLGIAVRRTRGGHDREGDVHTALRAVMVDAQSSLDTRIAALEVLASEGDDQAIQLLRSAVIEQRPLGISQDTAISLLSAATPGENEDVYRTLLGSDTTSKVRVAAILSLGNDRDSLPDRIAIAKNNAESREIREAALRSLLHDSRFVDVGLTIVTDETEVPAIRASAVAAVGLNILYDGHSLTTERLQDIRARLLAVDTIDREIGAAVKQALQRVNREITKETR